MADNMNEIWELYADDGTQALDAMEEALEALQDDDGDAAGHVAALFRAVHTFKGNSRVLGLSAVESCAHLSEDLIGRVRDEGAELTPEILDVLLLAGDNLRKMLDETARTRKDVDPSGFTDLMDQLRAAIAVCDGQSPEAAPAKPETKTEIKTKTEEKAEEKTKPGAKAKAPAKTEDKPKDKPKDKSEDKTPEKTAAPAKPLPGLTGEAAAFLAGAFGADENAPPRGEDILDDDWPDAPEAPSQASAAPAPAGDGVVPASLMSEVAPLAKTETGPGAVSRLLADDTYLAIFTEMVDDTIKALAAHEGGEVPDEAFAQADQLAFACERLELEPWVESLKAFEEAKNGDRAGALVAVIAALKAHKSRDLLGEAPEEVAAPVAKPQAEAAGKTEAAPQAAPEPGTAAADPAADAAAQPMPAASGRLADETYLKIFTEMVDDTIAALSAYGADVPDEAFAQADQLAYACEQVGLGDWVATLAAFEAARDGDRADALATLIEALGRHRAVDLLGEEAAKTEAQEVPQVDEDAVAYAQIAEQFPEEEQRVRIAWSEISKVFNRIAEIGTRLAADQKVAQSELDALADDIHAIVDPFGFVRAAMASDKFRGARNIEMYRDVELSFYEEMAAIEKAMPEAVLAENRLRPSAILRSWCSDHIFETLQALREGLERPVRAGSTEWFPEFETWMRRAFHASAHFKMETAGQLTMALIDLFARCRAMDVQPDVILLQIARGFFDTMELVFDALDQGDTPDIARLEQLFEEAANVSFVASGVGTARAIEQKLGLPKEFHKVLSPESVKAAQSAIDAGMNFFILRADLNEDDALAEKFLSWISAGRAKMITNVTVFRDDVTLFDFLVATSLSESRIVESLTEMDPGARYLRVMQSLSVMDAVPRQVVVEDSEEDLAARNLASMESLKLLEAIGEISAGQSMVASMLSDLANKDLMQEFTEHLRAAGIEALDPHLRTALRETVDRHLAELRSINEAEAQLSAQLADLQEQSVAIRSRPADVLLRPLQTFVQTRSRQAGGNAKLSVSGGDVILDQIILDEMRAVLKRLLLARISADPAPRKMHLVVDRDEDQIRVELTDDGGPIATGSEIDKIAEELKQRRGSLRKVALPDGGVRLHIETPLHMIVLEGMVVRVGGVHYVLPIDAIQRIHQGDDMVKISAGGGPRMLRIGESELAPIRPLPKGEPLPAQFRQGSGQTDTDKNKGTDKDKSAAPIFVIVKNRAATMAIPVDELLGQQLVLLRPLRGVLSQVRDMTGVAILTGGEIGMVVAISRLGVTEQA